ncbi:hypothetical protein ACE1CI_05890 [Aerosakkonemataceae cyanobacterium BLCC-F50]|uniref:Uncharacterized protein n=1 Tax=Floridaenema flaviceps BLCC-F50 TaxID=3153642 RepID=A0ABV4XMK6_9CYAN
MKILSSKVHGYLDYVVVIAFLVAPTLFGLSGIAAGVIIFITWLVTDYKAAKKSAEI